MSKIMVEPERPQMANGGALHAGLARLHMRNHTPARAPVFLCGIVSAMSGVLAAVTTKSFVV